VIWQEQSRAFRRPWIAQGEQVVRPILSRGELKLARPGRQEACYGSPGRDWFGEETDKYQSGEFGRDAYFTAQVLAGLGQARLHVDALLQTI